MSHRRDDPNQLYTRLAVASVPTVNRGLVCGPVGVDVGEGKPLFVVLVFMAETGRPITDFRWYQAGMHTSLTRFVGPHAPKARSYLQSLKSNGWTTRPSPLGTVLTSPKCEPG
jgi:hypothetical protein